MNKLFILLVIVALFSCRKEISRIEKPVDLTKLKQYINETESALLNQIDWTEVIISESTESFYRVALRGKDFGNEFLVFKQDSQQTLTGARHIKLTIDYESLNGLVESRMVGSAITNSISLENGFITPDETRSPASVAVSPIVEDGSGHLSPPMMAKIFPDPRSGDNTGPDYDALYYINIRQGYEALASSSGQYQLTAGERKNDYGGGRQSSYSSSVSGYPTTINIDTDRGYESAVIVDVDKMIACFNSIPDQGAACSIEIFTDLPVNDHPDYLSDMKQQYAGHCFLQLKKSNQGKSITQNIGLYPKVSIKSLTTTAPIPGKFVDDSDHSYNASLKMSLNFGQLAMILQAIKQHKNAGLKYDIDNYNCTDFAVNIINLVRPDHPIEPKRYDLPGGPATPGGTNLPQGVYQELFRLKKTSVLDRHNIKISTTNFYSNVTTTPCK